MNCGENFTLCLTSGCVFGWGDNKFGQIGIHPNERKVVPEPTKLIIPLLTGDKIEKIFCGWTHGTVLSSTL